MLSTDKGLLGQNALGDVIDRHCQYGELVGSLDIVVMAKNNIEQNKISDKVMAWGTHSASPAFYIRDAKKIGHKICSNKKIDLIVCQDPFLTASVGVYLKKKFKAKLLIHYHGDFWKNISWLKESPYNPFFNILQKKNIKQADAIRVMSQGQKNKLPKDFQKKTRVISTPVNLEKFIQNRNHKPLAISHKLILHVGRDDKVKDYDTLIRMFIEVDKNVSNVDLVQVAGGKEFLKAVRKNKLKSGFDAKDRVSHDELIELFYACDVFVLTSASESFGKVLVEANACGKPVVATATAGAKEIIIDGQNGYLVPVGDYKTMAEKVIYLLNNPDKAKEMGRKGREMMIERYGNNAKKIVNYWIEIVNKK